MRRLGLTVVLMTLTQLSLSAQAVPASPDPLIPKLRAFTPQVISDLAKPPRKVRIQYVRADLEGRGRFDLIVAAFLAPAGGKIRVLRDVSGTLQLAADLNTSNELDTSGSVELAVVDVAQTGAPQIAVNSYGSHTQYDLDLLTWTGTSLQSLLPSDGSFENAQLMDIDGDGTLEIVTPPSCQDASDPDEVCTQTFRVYKLSGSKYALAFTSPSDPLKASQSVFGEARAKPNRFSLEEIRGTREAARAGSHDAEDGAVMVQLGNLNAPTGDNPGARSVSDVDLNSLILGRNIRVLRARIVSAGDDDSGEDEDEARSDGKDAKQAKPPKLQRPFVKAKFSRQAVLEFLPRTQLNKPLQAGDVLTLDIRGKMKNGVPVFSSVTVKIVGDRDED